MDGRQVKPLKPYSLVRRLLTWGCLLTCVLSIATAGIVFAIAYDEARDQQDDLLEEVAWMLARLELSSYNPQALWMGENDFERWFEHEQRSNAITPAGTTVLLRTLHDEGQTLRVVFDSDLHNGSQSLSIDGKDFRIFLMTLSNGKHIAVGQEIEEVEEMALAGALSAIVPLLVFVVILFIVLVSLLWLAMKPVQSLEAELKAIKPDALKPLSQEGLPRELYPMVESVNQLMSRIQEYQKRESRFTADAAHELRTPLASLSLQLERLEKTPLSPQAREQLQPLRQSVDRAVRLVSQLLSLKRAQNNPAPSKAECNLSQVLANVFEQIWPEAEKKNIELEVIDFEHLNPDGTATVPIAEDELFAILRNLLENAVRYTPPNGQIKVRLDNTAPFEVTISDTGPGIDPNDRERVFDPFYRVLGTTVTGTGLGLAIVKSLCEKNRLTIRLDWTDAEKAQGLSVNLKAH